MNFYFEDHLIKYKNDLKFPTTPLALEEFFVVQI